MYDNTERAIKAEREVSNLKNENFRLTDACERAKRENDKINKKYRLLQDSYDREKERSNQMGNILESILASGSLNNEAVDMGMVEEIGEVLNNTQS